MKILKWIFAVIVLLVVLLYGYTTITGNNYVYKAIVYNYADIDDYLLFPNDTVKAGMPQPWPVSKTYNNIKPFPSLQRQLDSIRSVAFVVIKDDSICFEEYWDGYHEASLSNSFSVAKSIISILTGIALGEEKSDL